MNSAGRDRAFADGNFGRGETRLLLRMNPVGNAVFIEAESPGLREPP